MAATSDTIIATVHGGRQGHMPTWDERLTPAEIRILALYVNSLGTREAMTAGAVTKRAKWPLAGVAPGGGRAARRGGAPTPTSSTSRWPSQPECVAHLKEAGTKAGVPGGEARLLRKIDRCTMSGKTDERTDKSYGC